MPRYILLTIGLISCFALANASAQEFLGKNAPAWAKQLQSDNAKLRRDAAFTLGKMGQAAAPVLAEMRAAFAKEQDGKAREAIVFALGEICRAGVGRQRELETLFIAALADADPPVRRSAAYALGCLASQNTYEKEKALPDQGVVKFWVTDMTPESWQALDNLVANDKEPMVRQNAAWALGKFVEVSLPSLGKALKDDDSLVKRDAAAALLGVTKDADKVRPMLKDLSKMCRDTNTEVRRAALGVLVFVVDSRDKEAIPALKWAMEDRDLENRRNAALALSNIGGEESAVALPILLEAAKSADPELRQQAIAGISNIGPAAKQAIPELVSWLRTDPDAKIREYAALAIGGIGGPSVAAIPALIEKIQDAKERAEVRVSCCMALSRIGKSQASRDIVPTLLTVLGDARQEMAVRERVIWSLRVHSGDLRTMNGTKDTFARVLKEPLTDSNRMLRYDCAYMLGMVWQRDAPEHALDVLLEFLRDDKIKLYDRTVTGVGGIGVETKGGTATVTEQGKGDGRTMAMDALQGIGAPRYAQRRDIMDQLRALAADEKGHPMLRQRARELLKLAQ